MGTLRESALGPMLQTFIVILRNFVDYWALSSLRILESDVWKACKFAIFDL